jgi:hypothetical protein
MIMLQETKNLIVDELPRELLAEICVLLEARDVLHLAQTCETLRKECVKDTLVRFNST